MNKELNVVESPVVEFAFSDVMPEMIKLDDLSLALVGGGSATVVF